MFFAHAVVDNNKQVLSESTLAHERYRLNSAWTFKDEVAAAIKQARLAMEKN
jgi:hypothetical protein